MDPDANLEEQLEIVKWIHGGWTDSGPWTAEEFQEEFKNKAERLAELVEALDGWLSSGGFVPKKWRQERCTGRWIAGILQPPGQLTLPNSRCKLPRGHVGKHEWGDDSWPDFPGGQPPSRGRIHSEDGEDFVPGNQDHKGGRGRE